MKLCSTHACWPERAHASGIASQVLAAHRCSARRPPLIQSGEHASCGLTSAHSREHTYTHTKALPLAAESYLYTGQACPKSMAADKATRAWVEDQLFALLGKPRDARPPLPAAAAGLCPPLAPNDASCCRLPIHPASGCVALFSSIAACCVSCTTTASHELSLLPLLANSVCQHAQHPAIPRRLC